MTTRDGRYDVAVVGAGPAGATAAYYLATAGVRVALLGAAMTGVKPKTTFLRPHVAVPVTVEILRQMFRQKIRRRFAFEADAYRERAAERPVRPTAFANGCLLDVTVTGPRVSNPKPEARSLKPEVGVGWPQ